MSAHALAQLNQRGGVARAGEQPNPEAIAWYVLQAESLLGDLQERIQSLRARSSQLAGFAAAVVALVGGNADRILATLSGVTLHDEPELWRVHIRTIKGLLASIRSITKAGDRAVATLRWASLLFLLGLLAVAVALGIFIVEVTFNV